ncbi:transmembrane protein, putative (macronuclear) [Tetrahymena thermophila SB210]|uniref:Transmembrane protein, putative n=1 Tax=Tetrahymena thermophila (strain SB210) TaxID=312017 RepID=I7MH71_TETTS|nr:transmembrane protein, putative [Tetrahymena thermophila SB210]EAR87282.2 transmembrane protein, putative [Tetrahymena thermophila SB210]|eukprot:XP_001007527.2 transmembrane protein, putative [Tetrahymena thermophila SB210]
MQRFLPFLKSEKLESEYKKIQNQQIRNFFFFLCIVEIANYSYGFVRLIKQGVVSSRLLSSFITITLSYLIILSLVYRKHNLGIYLMPLLACSKPVLRWINNTDSLTMSDSQQYLTGIINILEFLLHLQSPNYFYKFFCILCYISQDIAFNTSQNKESPVYIALACVFSTYLIHLYLTDMKSRQVFLDNQKLFMWHQLIDKQSKSNFFIAKNVKKKSHLNSYDDKIQVQMYFINKQASQTFQCNTQEKFNAFLERIIIQEEEDMIDDLLKSRSVSEKASSNILINRYKSSSNKRTLLQICQQMIELNQKQIFNNSLSHISPVQEFIGTIVPEKSNQTQNQIILEGHQNQSESEKSQKTEFKSQIIQIKLFYYNLSEDYIIIQIDEEDYKIKAKKQKEEQKLALSFRDNLTYFMKEQIEFILQSIKDEFDKFKQMENYKLIMTNLYRMKQSQQNIIVALTDISNLIPYQVQKVNLKMLISSLLNLFSNEFSNQSSFPQEIFNYKLQNENIQSQYYWLNHIFFNLMQNCKQHGLKDGQIQIQVQEDQYDDNLINIDIINELNSFNLEQQLLQIEEMMRIQTQDDLFKFFYQKQIAVYNNISQNLLKKQFKTNSAALSPQVNPKDMLKSQLRYTLGIYVSRLALKRVGPTGLINFSVSDFQNKQSLIASFQIYKDISLMHQKEKENFTQLFGRNSILVNKDLQQAYTSYIIQQFVTNNNISTTRYEDNTLLTQPEGKKQEFKQQKIDEYLSLKQKDFQTNNNQQLKKWISNINEEDEGEENKNQIDNAFVQNKMDDEEEINPLNQYNNSSSMNAIQNQANMKTSLTQNRNKSLFFRDVIQSEKILEKSNEEGLILDSALGNDTVNNKNSLTQSGLVGEFYENSDMKRSQIKEQQHYKFKQNKNQSILDTIADEQIDQGAITKIGSQLITNRESVISKNLFNGKVTYRSNAAEICQVENQANLQTPTIYGQEKQPFILDIGEISLLNKDY